MKTLRTDLSSEGRLDILERTMPYRGGESLKKAYRTINNDCDRVLSRGLSLQVFIVRIGIDTLTADTGPTPDRTRCLQWASSWHSGYKRVRTRSRYRCSRCGHHAWFSHDYCKLCKRETSISIARKLTDLHRCNNPGEQVAD